MKQSARVDDPRLFSVQCLDLQPVQTVHVNPWFTVRDRQGYFTVEYNHPQTLVLPIVDRKAIVLARVRRPIICDTTWEVPAGGVLDGESHAVAACRELFEETGIRVDDLQRLEMLRPFAVTPRYPCFPSIFQVDLTAEEFSSRKSHDNEIEEVALFSFKRVLSMIMDGEIYIGMQVAILTRFPLSIEYLIVKD